MFQQAKEILIEESNVQPAHALVISFGDIHRQLHNLMELFKIGGKASDCQLSFYGRLFRSRSSFCRICSTFNIVKSVKYLMKIDKSRQNKYIKRQPTIKKYYINESSGKYGNSNVWKCFTELFDYIPLKEVIEKSKFVCLYGGISQSINKLNHISQLDRFQEVSREGPICDLL
ncbi:unnamed protein product [Paramecium sonneborni]|uniref:Calcineurin-like phosphoesterase domain-containing protein n=1 Tax=Paramecium sonneborni TaxID=65129 RepID=A0A8S1RSP0_9CILI|nr:unnamed protein product [Paramecium sonneborni]